MSFCQEHLSLPPCCQRLFCKRCTAVDNAHLKRNALHDSQNKRREAVIVLCRARRHGAHGGHIAKIQNAAEPITQKALSEARQKRSAVRKNPLPPTCPPRPVRPVAALSR